jgi:4-hydroxy-4-methyl-2-oxoglutarate aldolase
MGDIVDNQSLQERFANLTTPLIADACLRLKLPYRIAPCGIRGIKEAHITGRAAPVRHYGSVDIFLEVIGMAQQGDILVIDNGGRTDEACIGDLTVLEVQDGGLAGIVLWGVHRDSAELTRIGFPVFSYGAYPGGPERLDTRDADALSVAHFATFTVTNEDVVFADVDGVVFIQGQHLDAVISMADTIAQKERRQAQEITAGKNLREQLRFGEYLARRDTDATYTFRQHLRTIGGAIEE